LERLVEVQDQEYLGKDRLEALRVEGVDRKLVGIYLEGEQLRAELSEPWAAFSDGREVGRVTDAVWSPGLEKNIGYVWVPIELTAPGTRLDIVAEDGSEAQAIVAALPFVDPQKKVPAQSLKTA
jgi:aminomethyltransferase